MRYQEINRDDAIWRTVYEHGRRLFQQGRIDEAITVFNQARSITDSAFEVYHDLGVAHHQIGHYKSAIENYEKAISLNNGIAQVWLNGGNTLCVLNRHQEAISWYQRAIQLEPGNATFHYNLANTLKVLERYQEAVRHYSAAIKYDSTMPEAFNNLGTLLLADNSLDQAYTCFVNALKLKPAYPQALYNLGLILEKQGKVSQSIESVQRALQLSPEYGEAAALMVSLLQQACSWTALSKAKELLRGISRKQLQEGQRPSMSPFLSFSIEPEPYRNFKVARAWGEWICMQKNRVETAFDHTRFTDAKSRITIGYLSEQFRNAATAHLMAGLFACHDRTRFKVIAYSWGKNDDSYYRHKIANDVERFVDIRSLSNHDAAQLIYSDKVDILVDLMGWMKGHRMEILTRRPAPIQVNYLGYPGTSGASFMDYILADEVVIPPNEQACYSEKVVYLPECYQVTDPHPAVDVNELRRKHFNLPETGVVFCCFCTDYKIEANLFKTWMEILKATPKSVLWLIVRAPEAKANLRQAAISRNVDPNRLIFADPLTKDKHLARLSLADVALDTISVNGHTTASDTLWAGVPLITCRGSHFASRVAESILKAIGLHELVADTLQEYQQLAIGLANSPEQLSNLKTRLRQNKKTYPLFNIQRFARHLENAYHCMWQRYRKGFPPEGMKVSIGQG